MSTQRISEIWFFIAINFLFFVSSIIIYCHTANDNFESYINNGSYYYYFHYYSIILYSIYFYTV